MDIVRVSKRLSFVLRHRPDVHHEPCTFAALFVEGAATARVLEGPVPMWKASGCSPAAGEFNGEPGNGASGRTYGAPTRG